MMSQKWVKEFGIQISERIPELAESANDFKTWTRAVYDALREVQVQYGWTISPADRCYAGEYLCDFMLFEPGYGCRIACESQWMHWGREHQPTLGWAFHKLRGVKADVKLFVFEGSDQEWLNVQETYLRNYEQLSRSETFLALRWQKDAFKRSIWSPIRDGSQESVEFENF